MRSIQDEWKVNSSARFPQTPGWAPDIGESYYSAARKVPPVVEGGTSLLEWRETCEVGLHLATIFQRLCKIISDQLGIEVARIHLEDSFADDLQADSLDVVELRMAVEEEFGLDEIPPDDAENILTVEGAVNYLRLTGVDDEPGN